MTIIGESQTGTIISPISPGRIFFINSDLTVNLYNLTIQNCLVTEMGENGGAIYNNESNLNVNNCKFTNTNVAVGNGGAIYNNGGNLTITSNTFTSNTVVTGGNGGAIYNNGGNLTINTSTFTNNKIGMSGDGGAIYNNGGNLTITSTTFTSNTANLGIGGGAIYNNGGNLTINTSTFTSNTATMSGGAISNGGGILMVTNSTFTSNYIIPPPLFPVLVGDGGAIYNNGGNLTITSTTFTSNTAANAGAIFTGNGNCNITGSIFTGNSASNIGGAIVNIIGTMKVTGSTFTGNTAIMGGAINNGGLGSGGTLEVTNCTFTSNTALDIPGGGVGGAISNLVGTLLVTCSTFNGNTAGINEGKGKGSAIFNGGGDATIKFNRIVGNSPSNGEIAGERIDATLNWWGSNLSPLGKINELYGGIILFDPWITLNITADPTSILNGGSSTVTASLLSDNQGTYHDPTLGHVPDIQVTLTVPWGNFIAGKTITLYTIDGNITATFYANEGPVNPLYNPVRVDASADGYTTNALEAAYINIITVANLNITKTANVTSANVGDLIEYVITLHNNGPDNADNITIRDILPFGTEFVSTPMPPWTYSYDPVTRELVFFYGPAVFPNGATWIQSFTVRVNVTAASNTLNNFANVTYNQAPNFNQSNIVNVYINNSVVSLNKEVSDPWPNVGSDVIFTITATNNGPDPATNLVITDTLPSHLQYNSNDGPVAGVWDSVARTVSWTITTPLAASSSLVFHINATALASGAGQTLTNLVNQTHTEYPFNSSTSVQFTIPSADVELNKTVNNTQPNVGETVQFTLVAKNNGPQTAHNVALKDVLPVGLDYIDSSDGGVWDALTRTVTWPVVATLAANTNVTYYLTALVNSTSLAGTNVINLVNETQTEFPFNKTNNSTIYVPKSDLYIQISSNKDNPLVGETFTLRYKLGNHGPDTAENVTITIPIPDGFAISMIEGDGTWTIVGNNIIWTMSNVTVGDPDLYVTGWTTRAGSSLFTAYITSETYSINSLGVISLSLNAQPQVNAATTTIATGNTVGMQKTGTTLAGIVLAILMVLGGFIGTRKKQ